MRVSVMTRREDEDWKGRRRRERNERFAHRFAAPVNLIIGTRCHCSRALTVTCMAEGW